MELDLASIAQHTTDGQLSSTALHLDNIELVGVTLCSLTCLNLTNGDLKEFMGLADIFQ